ncbi:hypothetical protein AP3564_06255 [Aeribacillus pallidus]|uniref:Uncharacterized protein n=1 Tax=Aeribacillus pallidus TaxID=33936 RepID=A0A223E3S8_9BACI|nr:hypothetical protein AP3564_06255 [Aeribacillus pallidus]
MKPRLTLCGGIIALIIVMGIRRFAYTPILPYMNITKSMAGNLAGTLFVSFFNLRRYESIYLKIFLALNIFTTLLMGMVSNHIFWYLFKP